MNDGQPVRVLSICDDESLRYSRQLVLESEGYAVESITSRELLESADLKAFEIAILCHSVDAQHAARLADQLRHTYAGIRVLRVHAIQGWHDHRYDVDCEVLPDPVPLLHALKSLCEKTTGVVASAD